MIYSFLAFLKLYNFQNFINVACPRTPIARILAITLEKKLCQYKIYIKMRGGNMMACGVFV